MKPISHFVGISHLSVCVCANDPSPSPLAVLLVSPSTSTQLPKLAGLEVSVKPFLGEEASCDLKYFVSLDFELPVPWVAVSDQFSCLVFEVILGRVLVEELLCEVSASISWNSGASFQSSGPGSAAASSASPKVASDLVYLRLWMPGRLEQLGQSV